MALNTKHFGEIEVNEDKLIIFEHGIPGFPNDKRFIIISDTDATDNIYCWLQSVDNGDTSLILVDSFLAMPEYDPLVNEAELQELGEVDMADIAVFNVAVIKEDLLESTINLKAPIVINERTRKGKQVVVNNDEYTIRHNLVECIRNEGKV